MILCHYTKQKNPLRYLEQVLYKLLSPGGRRVGGAVSSGQASAHPPLLVGKSDA